MLTLLYTFRATRVFTNFRARVKEVVACPDGFENLHRQCFRFVDEEKTWAEADEFCKSLNSDLATLEALQERDTLKEVIEENYDDKTKWWIGYRRRDNRDRTFVWEWIPDGSVVQVEMLSDLVTTQAGSTDRRDFGWDIHFDFITRTMQSLNGPGARGSGFVDCREATFLPSAT
ncbi:C-type lectin domain family 4 member d-like [Plakobranchus ocellatus]|uniref:C-type lectin domain family 4 member d-like n=1 Tax=Plakobranchus ocellatus TaxID=259542 RepID=A0AAV3YC75_9GAST|nr:C-type lectin domain family 4 member d-like [Plakobranchus ocellatus]